MLSTRDLLQRFRPAGVPGAATATGVPADRRDERARELAAVFSALEATTAEAERIRRDAATEARQRRDRARQETAASVAQARLDAESLRAQVVAEARSRVEASVKESSSGAERHAHEIEQDAERTRSEDVAVIVAAVRAVVLGSGREEVAG